MQETLNLEVVKCGICDSKSYRAEKKLDGFNLVRCKRCGFVYVNPRPNSISITDKYSNKRQSKESLQNFRKKEHEKMPDNLRRLNLIRSRVNAKNIRLLDLGCGDSSFLRLAKKNGFDAYGLEIGKWAKKIAEKDKIPIYTKPIEKCNIKGNSFDAIHSDMVFEHLSTPSSVIKECYRILNKEGIILINVPNYNALSIKLGIDNFRWTFNMPPSHLNYFTPRTIKIMLKKTGFKNIEIISEWLGHPLLRKIFLYDKSPAIKRIVKRAISAFNLGNDLIAIARK